MSLPAPLSSPFCGHSSLFQSQPPFRAHLSTDRCPLCAASMHGVLVPVAAVRSCPLQHGKVPAPHRVSARVLVPAAAVRPQPLQHFKVPAPRRFIKRARISILGYASRNNRVVGIFRSKQKENMVRSHLPISFSLVPCWDSTAIITNKK